MNCYINQWAKSLTGNTVLWGSLWRSFTLTDYRNCYATNLKTEYKEDNIFLRKHF
jgi:hypothetical protein